MHVASELTLNDEFVNQILEHQDALLRRANQLFKGSTNGVEDLVQDTILKAALNEDKFKKGTNLKAWLFTILFNQFVNRHRRKKKFYEIVENQSDTLQNFTSALNEDTQDPLASLETEAILDLLSGNLDDIFFQVIDEVDVRGNSYKEAAYNLDVPVGTVMSRLYRARRKAQEVLVTHYDNLILEEYLSMDIIEDVQSKIS